MKKYLFILTSVFLFGCGGDEVPAVAILSGKHTDSIPMQKIEDPVAPLAEPVLPIVYPCEVEVFEKEGVGKIRIYSSPGDTTGKLIYLGKDYAYFCMKLSASSQGRFRVSHLYALGGSEDKEFKEYRNWWISSGKVFIYTSDICCDLKLFEYPSDTSAVIGSYNGHIVPVIDCNGKWLKVPGKFKSGKSNASGWIPAEVTCTNQFTNCCQTIPKKYIYKNNYE